MTDDVVDLGRCFAPGNEIPDEIFVAKRAAPTRATRDFERALFDLEPDLPSIGTVLDKYELERPIGIGGFAVVFRARHILLDTSFALKLLRPSVLRRRPELLQELEHEARSAAQIANPHVVRILDVTIGPAHSYIIMDYVHGLDLAAMLRHKGRLPQRMVLKLVSHVASALEAGLARGLIHRDVKPSNILLTRAGVTKLADFGLARSTSIRPHAIAGTLGYMSPEQIRDPASVDHRADIFSLGMTAYRALTGVAPTKAANTPQEALAALDAAFRPPHRLNTQVSPEVSAFVMAMLEREPRHRPQTYDEILAMTDKLRRAP